MNSESADLIYPDPPTARPTARCPTSESCHQPLLRCGSTSFKQKEHDTLILDVVLAKENTALTWGVIDR